MDKLTPSDRDIVKSCYMEHIAVRQLAESMNRPLKSVQNSLYRIRGWLLDCVRREMNKRDVSTIPIPPDRAFKEDGA